MNNSYFVDLTGVENRTELHDRIEQELPVPDWYGRNLDARSALSDAQNLRTICRGIWRQ